MKINQRQINSKNKPFVIAELGINHGGNLNKAINMVKMAAASGAECIKHQTHFVEDEMTEEAKEIFPPNANQSIWEVIENSSLKKDEEIELKNFTEDLGLIYISTPFSRSAADFLNEINIPAFKIGSGEACNIPLIRHIASFNKPIILSTGMHSIEQIKKPVNIFKENNLEFALLECTNLYPSPPEIVSLKGINDLKDAFPEAVIGFSDHSIGPYMALAAVALGACIIERHFTDSRYNKGPDISCSMDPSELRLIIDRSKEIYTAINNRKERTSQEEDVFKFARGTIVADRIIKKGTTISQKDIWARRPGNGEIPAERFDDIVGMKTTKDLSFNQQLKWSDLI